MRQLFDRKRLIGGGWLPDEPVSRVILTPLVEEKLNSYTAREDPFFAEVFQLCVEGNLKAMAQHDASLTPDGLRRTGELAVGKLDGLKYTSVIDEDNQFVVSEEDLFGREV